jgi:hypothetical protein
VVFPLVEVFPKEKLKEELRKFSADIFDNDIFYV